MEKLKFRNYVWPQNPHTYRETCWKDPEYFRNAEGQDLFTGLSGKKCIVTGEGVFFGENAYQNFRDLAAELDNETEGVLVHPLWGSRSVYFTRLEMTQEPRENYVSYRFTFVGSDPYGNIPKK